MEGTRVATVGVATFTISLFAALWILMCIVGRLTQTRWMYFVGGILLAIVVIIFAVAPREPGKSGTSGGSDSSSSTVVVDADLPHSWFTVGLILMATMQAAAVVGFGAALAALTCTRNRRAKVIEAP